MTPEEMFDEAVRAPHRHPDPVGALFAGLAAAAEAASEQRRANKDARLKRLRADPQVRARRSAAARKGWQTRRDRAQAAAREDEWEDLDDRPVRSGPFCDAMTHNSMWRETSCRGEPGHDGDHDDDMGTTWEREDDE